MILRKNLELLEAFFLISKWMFISDAKRDDLRFSGSVSHTETKNMCIILMCSEVSL